MGSLECALPAVHLVCCDRICLRLRRLGDCTVGVGGPSFISSHCLSHLPVSGCMFLSSFGVVADVRFDAEHEIFLEWRLVLCLIVGCFVATCECWHNEDFSAFS